MKWLKVARPAHTFCLGVLVFEFLPASSKLLLLFSFRVKKVPSVPESLLKKRQAYAVMKAKRQKKILAIKKVSIAYLLQ